LTPIDGNPLGFLSSDRLTLYSPILILRALNYGLDRPLPSRKWVRSQDVNQARKIIVAQAIATLLITAAGALFGAWTALIAFIGGATATAANALFAFWVFGRYRAGEPGRLAGQFYGGELLKLGFVAVVFAAAIVWLDPFSPLAFFGAFFVVQVVPPMLANRLAG
jgi:F0F1-type ATP synthase assembly protein I